MLFFLAIAIVVLVPAGAYWVNWRSENKVREARLAAIQKRLEEIHKEKTGTVTNTSGKMQ